MEFDSLPASAAGITRDPSQWCGEHAPAKAGYCEVHAAIPLWEHHDEKLLERFGIAAIFYCPRPTCDFFVRDTRDSMYPGTGFCIKRQLPHVADNLAIGYEIFVQDARLTILFLKHCQLVEKLKRMGYFEGGKQT